MKKQHLSFLLTCACCMMLCASLTSCPPGPDPEPEPTPTPTASSVSDFGGTLLVAFRGESFYYDSNGRFLSAKDYSGEYARIDYANGFIYESDDPNNIKFDNNGYVSLIDESWDDTYNDYRSFGSFSIAYTYNNQGCLVKVVMKENHNGVNLQTGKTTYNTSDETTYTLTWTNGNLTKITEKKDYIASDEDEGYSNYTYNCMCNVTYSDINNIHKQYSYGLCYLDFYCDDYNFLPYVGLVGKGSSKMPKKITMEDSEGNYDVYEMSYTLNENGTISSETFNGKKYYYSYRAIGDSRSSSVSEEQQIMQPRERVAKHGRRHHRHHRKYPNEK